MSLKVKSLLFLLPLLLLFGCSTIEKSPEDKTVLPADPALTTGTLENGLTYFIRENKKPENRTLLWLAVKAGSVLEDDDQLGLAHLVEHLAFNGTEKYPAQDLVKYLESIGMKFGPEINAYTNFDQTVYTLEIPSDKPQLIETGMEILSQWAFHISFEPEEVDKERGVVIEEWRLRRGAQARLLDKHLPAILAGSKYEKRLPIGDPEIIRNCSYETIKRFYKDWYRPELMGIFAVGDFKTERILELTEKYFSSAGNRENPRKKEVFPIPEHKKPIYSIATDPEAPYAIFEIYQKYPAFGEYTMDTYKIQLTQHLLITMLNQRFFALREETDTPFVYSNFYAAQFTHNLRTLILFGVGKNETLKKAYIQSVEELEKIRRLGFTPSELEGAKAEWLNSLQNAYNERKTTESSRFAQEYLELFLHGVAAPGIEWEYKTVEKLLPSITIADIKELTGRTFTEENRVVTFSAPDSLKEVLPSEEELLSIAEEIKKKTFEQQKDEDLSLKPLVKDIPQKIARITDRRSLSDIGVTQWKLDNGITVILKPTDFKSDEILFTAISPGGSSLVAREDWLSANFAVNLIQLGGLGEFDNVEISKKLMGTSINVSPFLGGLYEGFAGGCSSDELEKSLQLIYLYFTGTNPNSEKAANYLEKVKAILANNKNNPESVFSDTFYHLLYDKHYKARPLTGELLDEVEFTRAIEIFRDRFADAGDFTFFFVGSFDPDEIEPLITRWLGALPVTGREETWEDDNMDYFRESREEIIKKGLEPKSLAALAFSGPYSWSKENDYYLSSLVAVMDIKLREIIREDESGTYGISITESSSRYPDQEYTINITFGCSPERADELIQKIMAELENLKTEVDPSLVQRVMEKQKKSFQKGLKENGFWISGLQDAHIHGLDFNTILRGEDIMNTLTADKIQEAAGLYINRENVLKVILYPET